MTSSTVEIKLGTFGTYAQIGVSLIGAFLLLLGIARGFGVQDSIIKTIVGIFGKRRSLVPQTAVVSSMAMATVSGSGSANVAITGQFTIPFMKKMGFPPTDAGAVEASASMGGLIMPPVMAIGAFLMAEFLGVSYFEVIARGYAPAIVYYLTIALSVYLLTLRFIGKRRSASNPTPMIEKISAKDKINSLLFFSFIGILMYLMGVLWWPPVRAALITAILFFIVLLLFNIISFKGSIADKARYIVNCLRKSIEGFATTVAGIVLLLAVLGIMINLFTVSGWLLKLGMIMMTIGEVHILALVSIAFMVGIFLGLGLPPSATYILTATIIAPAMMKFGINPWVAHFFAFFLAIISEYSPPTSLTAAVASRISGASFMQTMFKTLMLSLPIFFLTFAIFNWGALVEKPGISQLFALGMMSVGCLGVSCSIYGKFSEQRILNLALRVLGGLLALVVLFYPENTYAVIAAVPLIALISFGIYQTRRIFSAEGVVTKGECDEER